MKRAARSSPRDATDRQALSRRVRRFYLRFNSADWDDCYALIDPKLTARRKVRRDAYSELMQAFKDIHGSVKVWWTRLSLHLAPGPKQRDKRPFAYVYVVWQDESHGFHLFRERWIRDHGQWYTRVVGLVPNGRET